MFLISKLYADCCVRHGLVLPESKSVQEEGNPKEQLREERKRIGGKCSRRHKGSRQIETKRPGRPEQVQTSRTVTLPETRNTIQVYSPQGEKLQNI